MSRELQDIMIFNLNLYPLAIKNIKKKVLGYDYTDFKKLQHYPKQKRSGQTFKTSCQKLNSKLEAGYPIKTDDVDSQEELVKLHGVKCGEAEIILYEDNIKSKVCLCEQKSVTKCHECPTQVFAEQAVDKDWLEEEKEKAEKLEKDSKAKGKYDHEVRQSQTYQAEKLLMIIIMCSPHTLNTLSSPASVTTRLRSSTPSSSSSCSSPS